MQALEFEKITSNMNVLYKKDNKIYATTVISTSLGHPSTRSVRLKGGFIYYYDIAYLPEHHVKNLNELIYADNAKNRTELLLESETILTDLNTE